MTTYTGWSVGDVINVCASISEFCGTESDFIWVKDINVTKSPDACTLNFGTGGSCSVHINNVGLTFSLVKGSDSANCTVAQTYKTIGSVATGANGTAGISYTVTEQDRLDYVAATNEGYFYRVMVCITNSDGQPTTTNRSEITGAITIAQNLCAGVTCQDQCFGNDQWAMVCNPATGLCVQDHLIQAGSPACQQPTHRIDFHIKPWSWYTPGGAVADLITLIADIDGTITNFFADIIDYQYINTEILESGNDVIIRINIKQLSLSSGTQALAWPLVLLKILTLVVLVGLIIVAIGMIYNYVWYLIANPAALNPTLTNQDLTDAGDALIKEQLDNCITITCSDPGLTQDQKATCVKNCHDGILIPWKEYQSKVYPEADHTPLDDTTTALDACYNAYLTSPKAVADYNTYLSCMQIQREAGLDADKSNTLDTYKPDASAGEKEKPGGMGGLLMLLGIGLVGMVLLTKGGGGGGGWTPPTIVVEK